MKCGACGELGHMRTNRYCPMYTRNHGGAASSVASSDVGMTEEEEDEIERRQQHRHHGSLSKIDGLKLTMSKEVINMPL